MNAAQCRTQHGDPAGWTDEEYEQFEQYATPGPAVPDTVIAFLKQPPPPRAIATPATPAA